MHFSLKVSALVAMSVLTAGMASASTLLLGSYANTGSNPGFDNSALRFAPNQSSSQAIQPIDGSNKTYNLTNDGTWAPAQSVNGVQSNYVSLNPGTGPTPTVVEPNGIYTYRSSFMVNAGAYTTGFLSILADDTADVFLNGHQVVFNSQSASNSYVKCSDTVPNCTTPLQVFLPTADFLNGVNDLQVIVYQDNVNATGVDFVGKVAETPEPSSLLLLGTGLMSSAGALLRRRRTA